MDVATSVEVGVRELKNHLSRYLDDVARGTDVVVTDRGRPVARLSRIDADRRDRLAALVEAGLVTPPESRQRRRPVPVVASGSVSDLVDLQRG
jgi:prevent-host-death family protein